MLNLLVGNSTVQRPTSSVKDLSLEPSRWWPGHNGDGIYPKISHAKRKYGRLTRSGGSSRLGDWSHLILTRASVLVRWMTTGFMCEKLTMNNE